MMIFPTGKMQNITPVKFNLIRIGTLLKLIVYKVPKEFHSLFYINLTKYFTPTGIFCY